MVKIEGLDKVTEALEELQNKAESLDGSHVTLQELFPDDFMIRFTDFNSIQELFDKSGFNTETQEDFENIPEEELDKFIAEHTRFETWQDMMSEAGQEYTIRQLGFEDND